LILGEIYSKKDPVPILPFQSMGFQQVEGQKHIVEVGDWVACDGDENTDPQCTDGEVPTVAERWVFEIHVDVARKADGRSFEATRTIMTGMPPEIQTGLVDTECIILS
jgi:hypothetical protein